MPSGWEQTTLGDLGRWRGGGTPSKKRPEFWTGQIPWVSPKDMKGSKLWDTEDHITRDAVENSAASLVPPRSVLVVTRSGILRHTLPVVVPQVEVAINQDLKALQAADHVNWDYAAQLIRGNAAKILRDCAKAGTTVESIEFGSLKQLPIALPPLPEQRKIAAILSSVDEIIEKTEAVIEQLQVVKTAMMQELLTRGLPGRHTRFKQTEIGEIPEAWSATAIGAVCERMFVGIAQAATHAYVDSGGIPIIRTTNVRPNYLRMSDVLQVSQEFAVQMRSKKLSAGDVLSARTGYPGTSVVVPDEYDGAQCFTLLVSRTGRRLLPQYLCHVMNSTIGDRIVSHGQAGGAQQNLNVTIFKKAIIPLPPEHEQQEIVEAIDKIYNRERGETEVRSQLQCVKSALMSVLLTGEVCVTLGEEAA